MKGVIPDASAASVIPPTRGRDGIQTFPIFLCTIISYGYFLPKKERNFGDGTRISSFSLAVGRYDDFSSFESWGLYVVF